MRWFAILACLFATQAHATIFDHEPAYRQVQADLESGDPRVLADKAFDAMFRHAARVMRQKTVGYDAEIAKMESDWANKWHGYLLTVPLMDMGDHDPMSIWVEQTYDRLEQVLGIRVMEMTHLSDIKIANFTIPVVFKAHAAEKWCVDNEATNPTDTCAAEYRRHFAGTKWQMDDDQFATERLHDGFAGIVTYWIVWIACEAATYGGGLVFICTPASELAEILMERYVAPGLAAKLWLRNNPALQ